MLAFLPDGEREAVIRFNVPRLLDRGFLDEVGLRMQVDQVRQLGWANINTGLIPGMAGVGVPILDAEGRAVAALSIGTLAERLKDDRLPIVVQLLRKEADGSPNVSIRSIRPCAIRRAASAARPPPADYRQRPADAHSEYADHQPVLQVQVALAITRSRSAIARAPSSMVGAAVTSPRAALTKSPSSA